MSENYKHLYEQTKKMLAMYQDELVPGFRKEIEGLDGKVCDLRKKWQAAETHICTMCEHFDHKVDGNIVYGNKTCGELVGYPCCGKFKIRATDNNVGSKWISVKERLPERGQEAIVYSGDILEPTVFAYHFWNKDFASWAHITHWMPLPEAPKEVDND